MQVRILTTNLRNLTAHRFSRRSILDFIHIVHGHVETLSQRLDESQTREEPLNLTLAFHALTGDVIMDYSFGFNYSQLKHPEFYSFHEAFLEIGGSGHVATLMPWIAPVSCRRKGKAAKKEMVLTETSSWTTSPTRSQGG